MANSKSTTKSRSTRKPAAKATKPAAEETVENKDETTQEGVEKDTTTQPTPETTSETTDKGSDDVPDKDGDADESSEKDAGETTEKDKDVDPSKGADSEDEDAGSEEQVEEGKVFTVSETPRVATIQEQMLEYISKMSRNIPTTSEEIRNNQIRLKNTINMIMSTSDEDFDEAFTEAVKIIRDHRSDAFSDMLVYRGFSAMRIREEERKRFEMLLQLMLAAADGKNIKSATDKVDLNVILRYVKDDAQANRLQSFFS